MIVLFRKDCCRVVFAIKDANDNHVLTVRSPVVICDGPFSCKCESKFMVNKFHA